jgi:dTDP-4-amino-4,6-dideoxygalactose transaminase
MSALLADLNPGDEVIMPSFTFVTTASAFALRGAVPVFVDIKEDDLNLDENLIAKAITAKTKAIVPMHYAGVACEMDRILDIARTHNLTVIEDAAHGLMSYYHERPLGSFGQLAAFSFHETKNIVSGEGGVLLVNDESLIDRAFTIWEKGTNRREFFLGKVDKYTWRELGSSFLPSEMTAAFLWAQLEQAEFITKRRREVWKKYHSLLQPLEETALLRRPNYKNDSSINGHIYYMILPNQETRDGLLAHLSKAGIEAVFHYLPLHSSIAGQKYGRSFGKLANTDRLSACLLRLPIWVGLSDAQIEHIAALIKEYLGYERAPDAKTSKCSVTVD